MSERNRNDAIETVVARIDENVKTLVTRQGDHENRIRVLEKWQWKVLGAGAFIGIASMVYEAIRH